MSAAKYLLLSKVDPNNISAGGHAVTLIKSERRMRV